MDVFVEFDGIIGAFSGELICKLRRAYLPSSLGEILQDLGPQDAKIAADDDKDSKRPGTTHYLHLDGIAEEISCVICDSIDDRAGSCLPTRHIVNRLHLKGLNFIAKQASDDTRPSPGDRVCPTAAGQG
jgi:hypothetical protein